VSTPENDGFKIDLSASRSKKAYIRPVSAGLAAAVILFIVLTMTTDIASRILPMRDDYLLAMIPAAPDGAEALGLKTDQPLQGLLAVLDIVDTTGRFGQTLELTPDPADIPPQGTATFQTTVTLQEKPAVYSLKFRFVDGPFIPHKDDRAATYGIPTN
jgi:hypothetical protein